MNGILAVGWKEAWELRQSARKYLITYVVTCGAFILLLASGIDLGGRVIPSRYLPYGMLFLFPLGIIQQLTSTSYVEEKRSKTLEVLLSTRLSGTQIILGKVLPAIVIAFVFYLFGFLSLYGLQVLHRVTLTDAFGNPLIFLLMPIVAYWFGGIACISMTIYLSDERMGILLGVGMIFGIMFLMILSLSSIALCWGVNAAMLLVSVVVTKNAGWFLRRKAILARVTRSSSTRGTISS